MKRAKSTRDPERLRKPPMPLDDFRTAFHYDPETGFFTRMKTGQQAGSRHNEGYRRIKIRDTHHYEHRLAWWYSTGEWTELEIDHVNGDKADNRIANLRAATRAENMATNKHDARGYTKSGNRFIVQVSHRNRHYYCGSFATARQARRVYIEAKRMLCGEEWAAPLEENSSMSQICSACGKPSDRLYQNETCKPCLVRSFREIREFINHYRSGGK